MAHCERLIRAYKRGFIGSFELMNELAGEHNRLRDIAFDSQLRTVSEDAYAELQEVRALMTEIVEKGVAAVCAMA